MLKFDVYYHHFRNSIYYKIGERSCFQCKGAIMSNALRVLVMSRKEFRQCDRSVVAPETT